jgi:hypothetical protein
VPISTATRTKKMATITMFLHMALFGVMILTSAAGKD